MADLSFTDASYIDDDFDSFIQDPDEPEYYQAKEEDFYTQSIRVKGEKSERSGSESLDSSLLEQLKGNVKGAVVAEKEDFASKCAYHVMIPEWICSLISEDLQNIPPKIISGFVCSVLFTALLGITLLFLEDGWFRRVGVPMFMFLVSLLVGVLGCWILVQEVNQDVEEEGQEFVANVKGLGLWELNKKHDIKINLKGRETESTVPSQLRTGKTVFSELASVEPSQLGAGNSGQAVELEIIPPGTLDYLLHRFRMQDPVRERQVLVQMGLGFIWLANASFIACGYLSAMDRQYPTQEQRELTEVQTNLVGITGWIVVAGSVGCLFKHSRTSNH